MHYVLSKETRERLLPLREIERHRLFEATKKIDEVMNMTEVGNFTELDDLIDAGAVMVTEKLEVKNRKSIGME